jgi:mRNA-degrading endonuclease HigB of HigAB toxin-antitoxin module
MKSVYPNAALVGRRTVFNIAGNKYRLIARVNYQTQRVFVLYLLIMLSMTEAIGKHEQHDHQRR